tara:strand:- start:1289 stop:1882 length:594 start_codon:yes stop_codon:yes gene_type:complete
MRYDRLRQCKDSNGGTRVLYAFPYVKYSRTQIKVVNNVLTVFPYTDIYDLNAVNVDFNENLSSEDGGFQSLQSLSYELLKISKSDSFKDFVNFDWRFVVEDNNGLLRVMGLKNGLSGGYLKELGAGKSDFNGFKFTYETKEDCEAPFLDNLDLFNVYNPVNPSDEPFFDYKERVETDGGELSSEQCIRNYIDNLTQK